MTLERMQPVMVIIKRRLQGRPSGRTRAQSTVAAVLAAGLLVAPISALAPNAAAQTTAPDKAKKPPTPGQLAARERLKKCAAEWKEAKAAGKIEKGMKWPKYWSACNKRLKTAS
jgi:hypothetical protein